MAAMIKDYGLSRLPPEEPLFVHEMDSLLDENALVLDLGSGAGSFNYGRYGWTIISADREFPAAAGQDQRPAIRVQCDAGSLPITSLSFDLVVSNFVFEHLANPQTALKEVERILKADGLFYLSIPNARSLEDYLYRLLGGRQDHQQQYSFHSLVKMVYENTSLKLSAFADWPAGFTWLGARPRGRVWRRLLLHTLRRIRPVLMRRTRKDSGYIFLFRKSGKLGFRAVTHICSNCGGGVKLEGHVEREWRCMQCKNTNSCA